MAKNKKAENRKTAASEKVNIEIPFEPNKNQTYIIYFSIAAISVLLAAVYLISANSVNGYNGFPLDDPWIHLTFAKNLAEYGSFSYFKNEMSTAGSTSPIYTMVLAVGFLITKNEMILSYTLGIIFFVLSGIWFYRLSSFEFARENIFAICATGIFIIDKWMNFIADSGMETTMFIFLLLITIYSYKKRQAVATAVFAGLIIWTRPDGTAFLGALVLDYLWCVYLSKKDKGIKLFTKQEIMKMSGIFGVIVLAYFGLNLKLSGSILPNTFNAKLTYYAPEFRSRSAFLENEVWNYFTDNFFVKDAPKGSYILLMLGFFISVLKLIKDLFVKKYNPNFVYVVFAFALVFIYWFKMPYAHRFGRYLMPIIPFLILVSLGGFRELAKVTASYLKSKEIANALNIILILGVVALSIPDYLTNKTSFAAECKYINDRQVVAAKWIRDNTKETDIIGTHDVGAIAFYSQRKIVDVAGLVTPELINKLHDKDYVVYMREYLKKNNVAYLAFLREWYRVVNQTPLFMSPENTAQEVMEVFKFNPDSTHILSKEVNSGVLYVGDLLNQKGMQNQALNALSQMIKMDNKSSLTYYLMAIVYGSANDAKNYEANLLKAIELYPDFKEVLSALGNYYKSMNNKAEAKKYLERYVALRPTDIKAIEMLKSVSDTTSTK
jgi:tetratricopeptide (TPR) repeat protein